MSTETNEKDLIIKRINELTQSESEIFFEKYTLVENPSKAQVDADAGFTLDKYLFDNWGDYNYILKCANDPAYKNRIWTYLDGSVDEEFEGYNSYCDHIVCGWHFINRIGYFITKEPGEEDETYTDIEYWEE